MRAEETSAPSHTNKMEEHVRTQTGKIERVSILDQKPDDTKQPSVVRQAEFRPQHGKEKSQQWIKHLRALKTGAAYKYDTYIHGCNLFQTVLKKWFYCLALH
jgi:hypothetical protein